MLRINPSPTFTIPVEITVPGQETTEIIRVTWRHKTSEQLAAWLSAKADKPVRDALDEVVDAWDGPADDAGNKLPYSREALGNLVSGYPASGGELVRAYIKGLTESRAKN